jgi:hypothetical protein
MFFSNPLVNRLWNSPTFNTWLSYSTKALSLFVVLPLVLKNFTTGEVSLWYLFATIIGLQGLADMGFKTTFIRFISYAMGGATDIGKNQVSASGNEEANWQLIARIFSMMRTIYRRLTVVFFILLVTLGTWSMHRPVSMVEHQNAAWGAWMFIVVISCIKFYGTIYANYLEGLNKIALVRRWEALTSLGSIATSILALIFFKSLIALIIANQIWVLINFFRDYRLSLSTENHAFQKLDLDIPFNKTFFNSVWHPAWRSGVSGLMSNGLASITSIIYAQMGSAASLASYLLALRLLAQVKEISMAPFYSKIPLLSKLRAQGNLSKLIKDAQRGMILSNLVFVVGAVIIGCFGSFLLSLIGSKVPFVPINLWLLLTFAYFVHRYGAMHIQLYSTTNHIISHVADGVSGIIFIITTLLLFKEYELYAIPIGMLCGYLGFYAWYSAYHSLKSLNMGFVAFESKTVLLPLLFLIAFYIINIIYPDILIIGAS